MEEPARIAILLAGIGVSIASRIAGDNDIFFYSRKRYRAAIVGTDCTAPTRCRVVAEIDIGEGSSAIPKPNSTARSS